MNRIKLPGWLQTFVATMGGGGIFAVAFLDSSVLSFPFVTDILVIELVHPKARANAVLRSHGSARVARGMHLALPAGEKRRRSIFSPARWTRRKKSQALGGPQRFLERFYPGDFAAAVAIQGVRAGGRCVSGAAENFYSCLYLRDAACATLRREFSRCSTARRRCVFCSRIVAPSRCRWLLFCFCFMSSRAWYSA